MVKSNASHFMIKIRRMNFTIHEYAPEDYIEKADDGFKNTS